MSTYSHSFQFGCWHVTPADNCISDGIQRHQMEPRAMEVLVALCTEANTVVSIEQLLEQCWGSTLHGDNPVHKTIAQLRKLLGDQINAPIYIETIRKRGYRAIASVQFDCLDGLQVGSWNEESPFRGLLAFDEQHAGIFFGRNEAKFQLIQQIVTQLDKADSVELFLTLGPSGSGKTSLIRAGLIPQLLQKSSPVRLTSHACFDLADKGQQDLIVCLAGLLMDLELADDSLFPHYSAITLAQALMETPEEILTQLQNSQTSNEMQLPARHLIFLDRLEAIFDEESVSLTERIQFLKLLEQLARSRTLIVVLACRNDFYPHIAASPILIAGKNCGAHFDLNPPSHAEIAQMIRLPALAAGLSFGMHEQSHIRLDDVLCHEASASTDTLPLLQYTLQELYRMRSETGELSFTAFHQLGGLDGAIGKRAEQVITQLSAAQITCLPHVLSLVTTISLQENMVTSRHANWSQLQNEDEHILVNALVEARLFVSELVNDAAGFGIAHEALLRRWTRVVDWINQHRSALQVRARINEQASRWEGEGRTQDLLLPEGQQLEEALSLLALRSFSLSRPEIDLIDASCAGVRSRQRARKMTWGILTLMAVIALMLAVSTFHAKLQAIERPIAVERLMSAMLSETPSNAIGKLNLSDSARAEALAYFANSNESALSAAELEQRPTTLLALAELSAKRGETDAAKTAWLAADAILRKQLDRQTNQGLTLKNLSDVNLSLGTLSLTQHKSAEASHFFQQALGASLRLQNNANYKEIALSLSARAHQSLGNVATQEKRLPAAILAYQQAIALRSQALALSPGQVNLSAGVADNLFALGTVYKTQGNFARALQLHQEEILIERAIHAKQIDQDLWAFRWAKALHELAENNLALGEDKTALNYLKQAEKLYEEIVLHEPANDSWFSALTNTKILMQDILARTNKAKSVLSRLHDIEAKHQQLGQINPKGQVWPKQAWTKLNALLQASIVMREIDLYHQHKLQAPQASLLKAGQKLSEAEQELYQQVLAEPNDHHAHLLLTDAIIARAAFERSIKEPTRATQTCQRGQALLTHQIHESRDFELLSRWLQLNLCLGQHSEVTKVAQVLSEIGYRDTRYLQMIKSSQ